MASDTPTPRLLSIIQSTRIVTAELSQQFAARCYQLSQLAASSAVRSVLVAVSILRGPNSFVAVVPQVNACLCWLSLVPSCYRPKTA